MLGGCFIWYIMSNYFLIGKSNTFYLEERWILLFGGFFEWNESAAPTLVYHFIGTATYINDKYIDRHLKIDPNNTKHHNKNLAHTVKCYARHSNHNETPFIWIWIQITLFRIHCRIIIYSFTESLPPLTLSMPLSRKILVTIRMSSNASWNPIFAPSRKVHAVIQ